MDVIDPRKLIAEFVGTFTLIFAGAGAVVVTQGQDLVAIALAHGLAIAIMVSALGHVSGGLFNPALTLGLWVTRRLDHLNTLAYIVSQLLGGVAGALLLVVLLPESAREAVSLGTPGISGGIDVAQAIGIEILLTAFLMLAVFGTALDARGPRIGGFAIGLVIAMDIFAGGPLTGAAMNPARALGPALAGGHWDNHLVYWVGPIVGAVLAALLYHYVFMDPVQRVVGTLDETPPAATA